MTGPKGNSEFCFPETLNEIYVPFCFSSQLKNRKKNLRQNLLFDVGWNSNLPRFQGARPDHLRVESSSSSFPRELLSFVRPRELEDKLPR